MNAIIKYLFYIIFIVCFYENTSYASSKLFTVESKKAFLSKSQSELLDAKVVKEVVECRFIYSKTSVALVKSDEILDCIDRFQAWFWSHGNYKILKMSDDKINRFHILDDYLGSKIIPYILKIHENDQAKLLRKIVSLHAEDLKFIKTLINHGVSVKQVLLREIGDGGMWASCDAYMIFLNKNIELYKKDKTLYEPIPDMYERKGIKPSYRWEDFHHLTNPTYNICPNLIEHLAKANPSLLNKKDSYDGSTPLHYYLRGVSNIGISNTKLQLVKILSTSTNINMQSNNGNTPLHDFLESISSDSSKTNKKIIEIMIARGANINSKNKSGVSVKDLLAKRPDLMELIK